MINVGKALSIMFWAVVFYVYLVNPTWELTNIIKIIGVVTINIHILEALWFLSWKESDKLKNIGLHLMQIIFFGAFHLKPLRDDLVDK